MKKLILFLILIFIGITSCAQVPALIGSSAPVTYGQATFTTTSSSPSFSPNVLNTGETLIWTATGTEIGEIVIVSDDPIFDFTDNTSTITVTVESSDAFSGVTTFSLDNLNIVTVDPTELTNVDYFEAKRNPALSSVDVSTLTILREIAVRSNNLSTINLSNNTLLEELFIYENNLTTIDLSNNPLLLIVYLNDNDLTTVALDAVVNQLDTNGLSNGDLKIINNTGAMTSASYVAYVGLINKGWTIDLANPNDIMAPETPSITNITQY